MKPPAILSEALLQFIWQHQYFERSDLHTQQGERLQIHQPGMLNRHQGPDFLHGQISLGTTRWAGNIEIHLRSSDWDRHHHDGDPRYQQLILHVVWEDDAPVKMPSGELLPTLVLQHRIAHHLLDRYAALMGNIQFVPCEQWLPVLDDFQRMSYKHSLATERILRKQSLFCPASEVIDWEELLWQQVAATVAGKVNAETFRQLAKELPMKLLARQRHQIHQLEALLLGHAGLLPQQTDDAYVVLLKKEFVALQAKFRLPRSLTPPNTLRMRPAAFPHLRLAQLAMVIHRQEHLFSRCLEAKSVEEVLSWFRVTANDYWHYHFHFGEAGAYQPKQLGADTAALAVINAVVPVVYQYATQKNDAVLQERCIQWLEALPGEQNSITKGFKKHGVKAASALDSQALIELKNLYCDERRCLQCRVGYQLLRQPKV